MKLGFFAYYKSFDFFRVGGTDSFMRRLTHGLIEIDKQISIKFILYGNKNEITKVSNNLELIYIKNFQDSLEYIKKENFDHIINSWLLRRHRRMFNNFAKKNFHYTKFHYIIFFYPDTILKKIMKFYELFFLKINGKTFVVSQRQKKLLKPFIKNLTIINPPVDKSYFLDKIDIKRKKIKRSFLGRIDKRKGIDKVIKIFKKIQHSNLLELNIHGIHIPEDLEATKIHNWLINQNEINYFQVDRERFSSKVDSMVVSVLKETDIFIQPYKNLDSTVDTPLLIIESLACNCIVLSTKLPSVQNILGDSEYLLDYKYFEDKAIKILSGITLEKINIEKKRIFSQRRKLFNLYETNNVAKQFLYDIK